MTPSSQTRLAGVIGDPVSHSLSPMMMNAWLRSAGIDAVYLGLPIKADPLVPALDGLACMPSVAGFNVTLPHKEAVFAWARERGAVSDTAKAIGAANVLTFRDGRPIADNTDAAGFLAAMEPAALTWPTVTALVLGAGGAARAIVHALQSVGVAHIVLTNRDRKRAERLQADLAPRADIADWSDRHQAVRGAHLVINATSLGLGDRPGLQLDWSAARPDAVAFDSIYTPLDTQFLDDARQAGLVAIDGLDMLIGQARPAYEAMFGQAPPDEPAVRNILVSALGRA
ncbi:shikimate dehydrogenase family protein [Maricaulis sp. CAU 1757]